MAVRLAPRRRRGANESNFGVLGKGKRVFHVDPEIAHRVLDLGNRGLAAALRGGGMMG